jgi:hypothetical protein
MGVGDSSGGVEGRLRRAGSGAVEQAVSGLRGSESSHGSSGGVRHGGGDREAESGGIRHGGIRHDGIDQVWWSRPMAAAQRGTASSFRHRGAKHRLQRQATSVDETGSSDSGAPMMATANFGSLAAYYAKSSIMLNIGGPILVLVVLIRPAPKISIFGVSRLYMASTYDYWYRLY